MLYLVRHGQTPYNAERRLQGQLDIPLDDTGRRQAEKLAERMLSEGPRVKKLYCSMLKRANETARIIGRRLNLTPVTVYGIEEIYFGKFQGRRLRDVIAQDPGVINWLLRSDFPEDTKRIVRDAQMGRYPSPPTA